MLMDIGMDLCHPVCTETAVILVHLIMARGLVAISVMVHLLVSPVILDMN
jgi:hypothetical protein